jgi:hypothetical protein
LAPALFRRVRDDLVYLGQIGDTRSAGLSTGAGDLIVARTTTSGSPESRSSPWPMVT